MFSSLPLLFDFHRSIDPLASDSARMRTFLNGGWKERISLRVRAWRVFVCVCACVRVHVHRSGWIRNERRTKERERGGRARNIFFFFFCWCCCLSKKAIFFSWTPVLQLNPTAKPHRNTNSLFFIGAIFLVPLNWKLKCYAGSSIPRPFFAAFFSLSSSSMASTSFW